MFWRRAARASRSCSMNTAWAAPRDNASRPSAPVPANASSTAAPENGTPSTASWPCDRMLNSASRARSLVGLTVEPDGASSRRPRCLPATIRMRHRASVAQLLAEHLLRHLVDLATRQIAELKRPVGEADQAGHLKTEMLQHPAHLAVLPLAQCHRDPGVAALLAFEARTNRAVGYAVGCDPFFERGKALRLDLAMDAHLVAPQPAGRRQFEPPRQRAVIGQQQEPLGIQIQTADRNQPRQVLRQCIKDGGPALFVAMRSDETSRLVITPQARAFGCRQRLAVDPDVVGGGDGYRRRPKHSAIDRDPPVGDPALGVATRAHPGACQGLGDTLRAFARGSIERIGTHYGSKWFSRHPQER